MCNNSFSQRNVFNSTVTTASFQLFFSSLTNRLRRWVLYATVAVIYVILTLFKAAVILSSEALRLLATPPPPPPPPTPPTPETETTPEERSTRPKVRKVRRSSNIIAVHVRPSVCLSRRYMYGNAYGRTHQIFPLKSLLSFFRPC